jgi:Uma2 family endonuclease
MRFTTADLEGMPLVEGCRYEIIDGELHVSTQPNWRHQTVTRRITAAFDAWDPEERYGVLVPAPGIVFAEDEAVAPDLVWVSSERITDVLGDGPHLHVAPDLAIEVLSPGRANEVRDRELKLDVYSRRGAHEYWIVDWRECSVAVHRRTGGALTVATVLGASDTLQSPLLPGFAASVSQLCRMPH